MFQETSDYLNEFLSDFADGIRAADLRRPQMISQKGTVYREGIGPFTEDETVGLVLQEFPDDWNGCRFERFVAYPLLPRNKCDLCIVTPIGKLFIEVKMMRLYGDNGKRNDNIITHILSPYPQQRSALTDIQKMQGSGFDGDKAILIYGYDYDEYPLPLMIDCFEKLAGSRLETPKFSHKFHGLVHPVHTRGEVYGWMLG